MFAAFGALARALSPQSLLRGAGRFSSEKSAGRSIESNTLEGTHALTLLDEIKAASREFLGKRGMEGHAAGAECIERAAEAPGEPAPVILQTILAPGDIAVFTAAVRDLHRCYPGRFRTAAIVDGPAGGNNHFVTDGNPWLEPVEDMPEGTPVLRVDYPLIHKSNQDGRHFIWGYIEDLNEKLDLSIRLTEFRPDLHLSAEEKASRPVEEPYWVVVAGGKADYATKLWAPQRWQEVVDMLSPEVRFVQVGANTREHPPLTGALDLRGRTTLRQAMQLVFHAEGVACPVTSFMHFAAAFNRPCVVVAYQGEAAWWEGYTAEGRALNAPEDRRKDFAPHRYVMGGYACDVPDKPDWGCWRSKVTTGEPSERCAHLRNEGGALFPECLAAIQPEDVAQAILSYSAPALPSDAPTLHVFANMGAQGGGEHSTLTLMEHLRKRFRVEFWPLTRINPAWRTRVFKASEKVHRDWKPDAPPELGQGEHALFYMNDYASRFCVAAEAWQAALAPLASVQMVLNFVLGGVQRQDWLADKLSAAYFLNRSKEGEWKTHTRKGPLAQVPTIVLPPPTELAAFLEIER